MLAGFLVLTPCQSIRIDPILGIATMSSKPCFRRRARKMRRTLLVPVGLFLLACAPWVLTVAAEQAPTTVPVGVAVEDITPTYPIRLVGYGSRKTESEGIESPLKARALVIGGDRIDKGGRRSWWLSTIAPSERGSPSKWRGDSRQDGTEARTVRGLLDAHPLRAGLEQRAGFHLRHTASGRSERRGSNAIPAS